MFGVLRGRNDQTVDSSTNAFSPFDGNTFRSRLMAKVEVISVKRNSPPTGVHFMSKNRSPKLF